MPRITPRRVVLALFWLAFLVALHWNSFTMPFERDEGEYAYSAWLLRHGQVPYVDAFMQKPPLVIYTYWLAQVLGGDGVVPPRVLAFLFLLVGTLLLARMVHRRYGPGAGFALLWLFPMLAMAACVAPFAANTERFLLLPLCALVAVLERVDEKSWWRWFWAGVFGALAVLYKPIPVLMVGFIWLSWLRREWRGTGRLPLRAAMALGIGAVGATFVCCLYFLFRRAGGALWQDAVAFNFYYTRALPHDSAALFGHLRRFFNAWWVLIPLLGYFLYKRPGRWLLYLGSVLLGVLSVRQTLVSHYYLMIVPFLAIMAAIGLALLVQDALGRLARLQSPAAKQMVVNLAVVPVLVILVVSAPKQYRLSPNELNVWIYGSSLANPFVEAPVVAEKLAALTQPQDRVFVFGSEPEVLYYARRQSATRFVIMAPFCVLSPFYAQYTRTLVEELSNAPPAAIVLTVRSMGTPLNNPQGAEWLQALLQSELKEYDPVGGYVSRDALGQWKEPLPPEDAASASFIVCRRIRGAH